ncbi:hypothetical protein [Embleya sp. NPDC005575]|uniref:hypothetical protein n=1 Tax=Embleya sp. NPDC005575 TaxID=3156892 RepID=UPI0033A55A61
MHPTPQCAGCACRPRPFGCPPPPVATLCPDALFTLAWDITAALDKDIPGAERAAAHLLAALTNTTPDPLGPHHHDAAPLTDRAALRRDLAEHLHDLIDQYADHARVFNTEDLRASPEADRWMTPRRHAQLARLRTALADITGQNRHAA